MVYLTLAHNKQLKNTGTYRLQALLGWDQPVIVVVFYDFLSDFNLP